MSENRTPAPGLSTGLKSMLIILGVMLSIIIFLIWSGIIRSGSEISTGTTFATPTNSSEDSAPQAEPEQDPVAQAREPIIAMVDAPTCENAENDSGLLSEFVTVALQQGGLSGDDRQLIEDTLHKIDEECSKDFAINLYERLSSGGVAIELSQLSAEAEWLSMERPAPDDASSTNQFSTDNRNIHCTIESGRVACSIYAYTFPSVPETCETYTQTYVVGESSDTDALCSWRLQADNEVSSGAYANDKFACEVRNSGTTVECWSQLSGKGFEVNRATGRTF